MCFVTQNMRILPKTCVALIRGPIIYLVYLLANIGVEIYDDFKQNNNNQIYLY